MKIVFFGTSNVALPVLESLSQHHEVAAVVTTPDAKAGKKGLAQSPVSVLAGELSLPLLKPIDVMKDAQLASQLEELAADVFIVVSYGKLLPEKIINMPRHKSLNIHFSKLPLYRGPAPIQFALMKGEQEAFTTIFVLVKELDEGPIVAQQSLPIDADDNFITLSQKMAVFSAKLLLQTLPDYASAKIIPKPQDHSQATYTKIITKADGKANWHSHASQIYNQFRALYPWPGLWTQWEPAGQLLKILDCIPLSQTTEEKPGKVLPGGAVSAGGGSVLQIKSLQLAGKQATDIQSFLNGYRTFVGSTLS